MHGAKVQTERERLTMAVGAALAGADRLEAIGALMLNMVMLWGDGGGASPSLDLIHRTIDRFAEAEVSFRARKEGD